MEITFSPKQKVDDGVVVVGLFDGNQLTLAAQDLDNRTEGAISRALDMSTFSGKLGETLTLIAPQGTSIERLVLLGLGKTDDCCEKSATLAGGKLAAELLKMYSPSVTLMLDGVTLPRLKNYEVACHMASGILLRSYRFTKYKTQLKAKDQHKIDALTVITDFPEEADKLFQKQSPILEGVFMARNLMCEPPNVLTPSAFAKELSTLKSLDVKIEILDEAEMRKLGMGALLAVGQGSDNDSHMVVMHWQGGEPEEAPIALVGKGVTFDTGGISIKPSAKMDEMKMDMGGAALVAGTMKALAGRKAKVNVIGVVGLVENMPDGKSYRPGDIIKSYSGQTIEVLNTDAEGRLVLADALWYTQDRFRPQLMVDFATLTGAICIALGTKYAAALGTDQKAIDNLKQTGECLGEHVWQMPLDDRYDRDIDSKIADVKNTGAHGAGAITASHFLKRFTNNVPWIHMDIAGVAWSSEPHPLSGSYPSGWGVRLMDQFISKHFEKRV